MRISDIRRVSLAGRGREREGFREGLREVGAVEGRDCISWCTSLRYNLLRRKLLRLCRSTLDLTPYTKPLTAGARLRSESVTSVRA